ncbi:MAG: hypothetical protein EXR71_15660 [Myxococcales bacterium]|nr:hypothetical protein [Myxococcales bacterium]
MAAPAPTVNGYQGQPLPFRLTMPLNAPAGVGVVFPGAAYSQDRPLCATTRDVLAGAGLEVFLPERYYGMDPALSALTGDEREACIATDSGAFARVAFARAEGRPVILAGKSLGTSAMAHAYIQVPDLAAGASIWLTPLWKDESVFHAIAAAGARAFVLIGSADPQWDASLLAALNQKAMRVAKSVPFVSVVEGADHGMTVAGNAAATARALVELKPALVAFVSTVVKPAAPTL